MYICMYVYICIDINWAAAAFETAVAAKVPFVDEFGFGKICRSPRKRETHQITSCCYFDGDFLFQNSLGPKWRNSSRNWAVEPRRVFRPIARAISRNLGESTAGCVWQKKTRAMAECQPPVSPPQCADRSLKKELIVIYEYSWVPTRFLTNRGWDNSGVDIPRFLR